MQKWWNRGNKMTPPPSVHYNVVSIVYIWTQYVFAYTFHLKRQVQTPNTFKTQKRCPIFCVLKIKKHKRCLTILIDKICLRIADKTPFLNLYPDEMSRGGSQQIFEHSRLSSEPKNCALPCSTEPCCLSTSWQTNGRHKQTQILKPGLGSR